jgi:hypothetical protein
MATIPVARISAQARQANIGRALLTMIAAMLYAPGWLVGKVFLGAAWACVAVRVGFQDARGRTDRHGAA